MFLYNWHFITSSTRATTMTEAFRPSSITRYINCNLWRFLPREEKSSEQKSYLAERSADHRRLEQEKFTDQENECSAYFFIIKERSSYLFKEQLLSMEIGDKILQGTPDVYAYDEQRKILHILDYKTGRSYVKAEDNDQLLAYAMLAMENHPDWNIEKVELAILNTQYDSVDVHSFTGKLHILSLKRRIEQAVHANENESTFGKPGKWCQFCPSKRYCIRQRDYQALKDYADLDTDNLIYQSKKRQNEVIFREKEVKSGVISDLLTPLLAERSKRSWKEDLPDRFYTMKPMTVSEAEERFSPEDISPYINQSSYTILRKPS